MSGRRKVTKPTAASAKKMDGRASQDNLEADMKLPPDMFRGPVGFFEPKEYFNTDDHTITLHKMIRETAENKVIARLFRLLGISFVPLLILFLLAAFRENLGVNFMFGNALLCMFTFYFIHIFTLFCTANNGSCCKSLSARTRNENDNLNDTDKSLFRVYSVSSLIPDCTNMSICFRALTFRYQAITSISEFSAIQGGIAQLMLLVISSYSWVVLLCAMAPEVHKYGFKILSAGDVCEMIGCFGLVIIGTFELDPFNKVMKRFHNTGAMLGSLTLIGFLYQQIVIAKFENNNNNKNMNVHAYMMRLWLPLTMIVMAVGAYFSWNYFSKKAEMYDPDKKYDNVGENEMQEIRNTVTKISFGNVVSEAIVLYCGAASMCLWLMYFDSCHQYNFCRPW